VRKALAAAACALGVLVAASAAAGEEGPEGPVEFGFLSNVSHVDPLVLGLDARVLGGDDRLRVANLSGKTVVILGYDGEPYLRFTSAGVFENRNSPTAYRNRDRWGVAAVPAAARPRAVPRWRRVTRTRSYAWYDHRIQWMRRGVLPAVVRAAPRRRHKVFDWAVPGRADGKPFAIRGILGYAPPPAQQDSGTDLRTPLLVGVAIVVIVLLGAMVILLRRLAP
jgi:hypothetical protein